MLEQISNLTGGHALSVCRQRRAAAWVTLAGLLTFVGCATDAREDETAVADPSGSVPAVKLARNGTEPGGSLPDTPADQALAVFQTRAAAIIDRLSKLGESDPGFAGVGLDASAGTVIVYRKDAGSSPQYLQMPGNLPVVIRPALLSAKDSQDLMDSIWSARSDLAAEGITVTGVTTTWDGPVTIRVEKLTAGAAALAQRFSSFGPGTVRVEQGDFIRPLNRFNDTSPYFGGDRINGPGGPGGREAVFTSGFGGLSKTNGRFYMITAYHGMNPHDPRVWTHSTLIGTASVLDSGHDLAYIPTSGTAGRVWDGRVYPTSSEFAKDVIGARKPAAGMHICTLGSFSGARCYGAVRGHGHFTLTNAYTGRAYDAFLWYATKTDQTQMSAEGDSGGPVIIPSGNHVYAVGTVSAGSGSVVCATGHSGDATICFKTVYFPDIYTEAVINHHLDLTN